MSCFLALLISKSFLLRLVLSSSTLMHLICLNNGISLKGSEIFSNIILLPINLILNAFSFECIWIYSFQNAMLILLPSQNVFDAENATLHSSSCKFWKYYSSNMVISFNFVLFTILPKVKEYFNMFLV